MDAVEIYENACKMLDRGEITLGDFEKIINPLHHVVTQEEAIPISWIEAKIARFIGMDNAFAGLTVNIIKTMLNEWRKEARGEREHNK